MNGNKDERKTSLPISPEDHKRVTEFLASLNKFKSNQRLNAAIDEIKTIIIDRWYVYDREKMLEILKNLKTQLINLPSAKDNSGVFKDEPTPNKITPLIKSLQEQVIPGLSFYKDLTSANEKESKEAVEINNSRKEHYFHQIELEINKVTKWGGHIHLHLKLNNFLQWEKDTEKQLKSLAQDEVKIVNEKDILIEEKQNLEHRLQALESKDSASQAKSILSNALGEMKQSIEKHQNELIALRKEKGLLNQKLTDRKNVYTDLKAVQSNLKGQIDGLWQCYFPGAAISASASDDLMSKIQKILEQDKDKTESLTSAASILDGSYTGISFSQHHPAPSAPPIESPSPYDPSLAFLKFQQGKDSNQPPVPTEREPEEEFNLC